ncbi:MAG: hypothetical protein ACTS22_03635 [Phycisphaerales bacterium]
MIRCMSRSITGVVAVAALAGLSPAQDAQLLLDVRVTPISDIDPATKDQAAYRALTNLGARLELLPRETGEREPNAEQIRALWQMLTGGGGLQVYMSDDRRNPFSLSLSLTPANGTEAVMPLLEGILDEGFNLDPEPARDGVILLDGTPHDNASVRAMMIDGRDAFAFRIGTEEPAPVTVERLGLPEVATPLVSGEFVLGVLLRNLERELMRDAPDAADLLRELGLFDARDASLRFALATHDDALHSETRLSHAEAIISRLIGDASLDRSALGVVPEDATLVAAGVSQLDWLVPVIEAVGEEFDRDIFGFLRDGFGIDLRNGVLENLGPVWVLYQSDSTGGGGIMSSVLVCQLRDADAFRQAHAAALVHANQAGATLGKGYGRTREWSANGVTAYSLVAAGIPIPFEPSWSVTGDRLVVAASPTALIAAMGQLESDRSVLDQPLFRESVLSRWPDARVTTIGFRDTARTAARGYGLASLAASALANAVRRPMDDFYDPGVLLPSYADFIEGIHPSVTITTIEDGTVVARATADASVLVQAASASQNMGYGGALVFPALGAGVMLPAIGQARQAAEAVRASVEVQAVSNAYMTYQADHNEPPTSMDQLIEGGYLDEQIVTNRSMMPWDDGPAFAVRWGAAPDGLGTGEVLLVVDRARYINGLSEIPVTFSDGSSMTFDRWSLDNLLEEGDYADLREQLQEQYD